MKYLISVIISCILFISVALWAEEKQKEPEQPKSFIIIGILDNTSQAFSFYNQTKFLAVRPFNTNNPIDITPGLKDLAAGGHICDVFGHHPKVGICDFCKKENL